MAWLNLGVYGLTFVLTAAGIIVSVYPPQTLNTKLFAICIILIFGAGLAALSFLQKQADDQLSINREERLSEMQKSLEQQAEQIRSLVALSSGLERSEQIAQQLARIEQKISADSRGRLGLKQRTREVSVGILKFLLERERGQPPNPRPASWSQDVDLTIRYMQETMQLYSLNFASRVIALRAELAEHGFTDAELDKFYEHPTNPLPAMATNVQRECLSLRMKDCIACCEDQGGTTRNCRKACIQGKRNVNPSEP